VYVTIGLLSVASSSYLISISRRQQVALIKGSPIYVVTGVALIPLSSQTDAESAILQAQQSLKEDSGDKGPEILDSDGSEDEEKIFHGGLAEDDHYDSPTDSKPPTPPRTNPRGSSVAEDVIGKRGQYGRFAEKWFSKKGWSTERRRAQGMSTEDLEKTNLNATPTESAGVVDVETSIGQTHASDPADSQQDGTLLSGQEETANSIKPSANVNVTNTLSPKLLQTTRMLLASKSFYFSYDYDITRRIGSQCLGDISMYRAVDPLVRSSPFPSLGIDQAYLLGSSSGTIT